jgi:hypothetical protein
MQFERVDVSTHSGFKADERPLAFIWRGREYRIEEIIDRWYEGGLKTGAPALSYFKVRADDTRLYLLRYNGLFDGWAIVVPPQAAG